MRVEQHLDSCGDCRRLVSSLVQLYASEPLPQGTLASGEVPTESAVELPLMRGDTVGRYMVLDFLGAGAMGVVHSAYDPELDRKIALKLVRASSLDPELAREGRARLLREAKTMARVSHPNVVAVHDAGTYGSRVFVAMELVEGVTLRKWLQQARPWREVLDMFVQAGRGLAAAHAAGLVHRDFKPENVLIDARGRVRVTDFGLARAGMSPDAPPEPSPPEAFPSGPLDKASSPDATLTVTGQRVGTPAYMSPEQHAGQPTGPQADQFSFCVALYEGLYGQRPFPGDSVEVLVSSLASGKIAGAPAGANVPPWLRRVLLRGLSFAPGERYPSMDALLEALTARPRRVRRSWLSAGVAIALLAAGAAVSLRPDRGELCRGAERKLAGSWDGERKGAIGKLFLTAGLPSAADTWVRTQQAVDSYTRAWTAMHTEACEATRVRGEQSDEVLSLRMLCLDRRLTEVKALAQVLGEGSPDAQLLANAVKATQGLTPLEGCADVAALKAQYPPPADPASRAKVDELRARLAEARALHEAGKGGRDVQKMERIVADARTLGYPPVLADSLFLLGAFQEKAGDSHASEQTLYEAIIAAETARDNRMVTRLWITLIHVVGARLGRHEQGLLLEKPALAALARLGDDSGMRGALLGNIGNVLFSQGKLEEALEFHKQSLAFQEKAFGPRSHRAAILLNNVAVDHMNLGQPEEAAVHLERSLEIRRELFGPRHPEIAVLLNNLGALRADQNRHHDAMASLREALSIREEVLGPKHVQYATTLNSLARTLCELGRFSECEPMHRRAVNILETALGPKDLDLSWALVTLAEALSAQGRYAEACGFARRSVALAETATRPDDASLGEPLRALATCLEGVGQRDRAMAALRRAASLRAGAARVLRRERALALVAIGKALEGKRQHHQALARYEEALKALPEKAPERWAPLREMGEMYLGLGQPWKARELLERALVLREGTGGDPRDFPELRFALARALWAARHEPIRALTLAEDAKEGYGGLGDRGRKGAEQVAAWLAEAKGKMKEKRGSRGRRAPTG